MSFDSPPCTATFSSIRVRFEAVSGLMICSRFGASGVTTVPSGLVHDSISERSIFSPPLAMAW